MPRLCEEEGNVCCCSPLPDAFCISWLPQHRRSGCKIYLGQSYKVSAVVPCLSSLGGSEYLTSISVYLVGVSVSRMVHCLQGRRIVRVLVRQKHGFVGKKEKKKFQGGYLRIHDVGLFIHITFPCS